MRKIILFLGIAVVLIGCNGNVIFSKFYEISDNGWNKDSVLSFDFDISDTLATYTMTFLVRNTDDFPRQNLWLGTELLKDSNVLSTDTTNLFLSDDYGKWRGRGAGSYFDNEFLYKQNVTFYKSGTYTYKVYHLMRFEDVKGLKYVGLKIFKEK